MAYFNNDIDAAEKIAQTLASYPDTSWDNVDRLVRRAMSQYGYRPVSGKAVVLKVVDILKSQGKFNDWGDPSNILGETVSKHRKVMDDHFKRARAYLYGFPTATQDEHNDKEDAGSTTTVIPATDANVTEEDQENSVADGAIDSDDTPMEEAAEMGMSDEVAAKKIADKLKGTPDLTFVKIQQMVPRYLDMVGKAPTDAKHLAVLVFDELQDLELAEANIEDDLADQAYLDKRETDYISDANTPEKGVFVNYGIKYDTYVFDTIDAANAFMTEHSGWGAIGETPDGKYHVARMDDEGTPSSQMEESMLDEGEAKIRDDGWFSIAKEHSLSSEDRAQYDVQLAKLGYHVDTDYEWSIAMGDDCPDGVEVFSIAMRQDPMVLNVLGDLYGPGAYDTSEFDDDDEVDEAQDAVIHIPRDQSKDFANDVLVGGIDGPEQDLGYIRRMRTLAGLK